MSTALFGSIWITVRAQQSHRQMGKHKEWWVLLCRMDKKKEKTTSQYCVCVCVRECVSARVCKSTLPPKTVWDILLCYCWVHSPGSSKLSLPQSIEAQRPSAQNQWLPTITLAVNIATLNDCCMTQSTVLSFIRKTDRMIVCIMTILLIQNI